MCFVPYLLHSVVYSGHLIQIHNALLLLAVCLRLLLAPKLRLYVVPDLSQHFHIVKSLKMYMRRVCFLLLLLLLLLSVEWNKTVQQQWSIIKSQTYNFQQQKYHTAPCFCILWRHCDDSLSLPLCGECMFYVHRTLFSWKPPIINNRVYFGMPKHWNTKISCLIDSLKHRKHKYCCFSYPGIHDKTILHSKTWITNLQKGGGVCFCFHQNSITLDDRSLMIEGCLQTSLTQPIKNPLSKGLKTIE